MLFNLLDANDDYGRSSLNACCELTTTIIDKSEVMVINGIYKREFMKVRL